MIDCWIHLDEVGTFHEPHHGRSSIGGWLTFKPVREGQTKDVLRVALQEPDTFAFSYHAQKHKKEVEGHLRRALPAMRSLGWEAAVFSVQSGAFLGHPIPTYVHAMADGLLSLARHLSRQRRAGVRLHVAAALWSSATDKEYQRISERLELERLRRQSSRLEHPVEIDIELADARLDERLMIADMVMYGLTHVQDYGDGVQRELLAFLGSNFFPVLDTGDEQRLHELMEQHDYAQAFIEAVALMSAPTRSFDPGAPIVENIGALAAQPYVLDTACDGVANRIDVEVAARRLDVAERQISAWLDLLERLCSVDALDAPPLEKARVRALEMRLRCCNHRGDVIRAEAVLSELRPACTRLGAHLEAMPLIVDARCNEGVHRTNVYDFDVWNDLVDTAEIVVDMHAVMKRLVSVDGEVRSALRGRLLGTALQACVKAARNDPALFETARELSQSAIAEFTLVADLRRQYGYRCELETDAGDLDAACAWLRVAAGFAPDVPLPEVLSSIAVEDGLGFNVMHATRIWAAAERLASSDAAHRPLADLLARCYQEQLCARREIETSVDHPWPLIAWMVGRAIGLRPRGNPSKATRYLESAVTRLELEPANLTLLTLALGARCDRAAVCLSSRQPEDRLDMQWAALQHAAAQLATVPVPTIARWFRGWPEELEALRHQREACSGLRGLALRIPY